VALKVAGESGFGVEMPQEARKHNESRNEVWNVDMLDQYKKERDA
jgi:hypothetical protein